MDSVFIYWDNSNIFHEAQRLAEERNGTPGARYLIRIHFERMMDLARAERPVKRAVAAGSVPPEMRQLWNRLENSGVEVNLFDRGDTSRPEQQVPDQVLQLHMLKDALIHNGDPGIAVLLTGDGAGYEQGQGFPQRTRVDARQRMAHRDHVLGALVQSSHAPVGRRERCIRRARRLLRLHHVPRAIAARAQACTRPRRRAA